MLSYADLGAKVTKMRQVRSWSRRKLARKAGVSESTLKNMENGARPDGIEYRPSQSTLLAVAEAFGLPDGAELLRMYGEDDKADYFEETHRPGTISGALSGLDMLPDDQRVAIQIINDQLVRLLLSANTRANSAKGAYLSSGTGPHMTAAGAAA